MFHPCLSHGALIRGHSQRTSALEGEGLRTLGDVRRGGGPLPLRTSYFKLSIKPEILFIKNIISFPLNHYLVSLLLKLTVFGKSSTFNKTFYKNRLKGGGLIPNADVVMRGDANRWTCADMGEEE